MKKDIYLIAVIGLIVITSCSKEKVQTPFNVKLNVDNINNNYESDETWARINIFNTPIQTNGVIYAFTNSNVANKPGLSISFVGLPQQKTGTFYVHTCDYNVDYNTGRLYEITSNPVPEKHALNITSFNSSGFEGNFSIEVIDIVSSQIKLLTGSFKLLKQ